MADYSLGFTYAKLALPTAGFDLTRRKVGSTPTADD